ncbi:hypothetical protein BDE36_4808 [Arcticibacter tournemirensis]|nr:hypothetical protein BDE36_4808 [Arcticibacter tournemirensis]
MIASCILLTIFFISDDTVTFGTNRNQAFIVFRYIVYVILSIFLFALLNCRRRVVLYSRKELISIGLLLSSFLTTVVINIDFRPGYLLQLLTVLFAMLIVKYLEFGRFITYYSLIIYFLSVISLIVFVISLISPGLLMVFPTTVNFGGTEFINLFLCSVFKETTVFRNTSIFREPGVYTIYLLFGLIIEFFLKERPDRKRLTACSAALITTFSTSGIFVFAVVAMGFMFKENKMRNYISILVFLSLVAGVLILVPGISNQFFSKLSPDSSDYFSTIARLSSFIIPLEIFVNNPLAGVGLTNFVTLYSVYSMKLFNIYIDPASASTNTIVNTFAIFGLFYGALLMYSMLQLSRRIGRATGLNVIVLIAFLMILSSQDLRYSLFMNVLFMYGLLNRSVWRSSSL